MLILGLQRLHAITKSQSYQLRVDLEYWDNNIAYAVHKYDCSILFPASKKLFLMF